MENQNLIPESEPKQSLPSKRKTVVVIALLFLIVLLAIFYWGYNKKLSPKDLEVKHIPKYFVVDGAQPTAYKVQNTKDYFLQKSLKETVDQGAQYTVQKPYNSVLNEFYAQLISQGWIPTAGTSQKPGFTQYKMVKGVDSLFLTIESTGSNSTKVTILPVTK